MGNSASSSAAQKTRGSSSGTAAAAKSPAKSHASKSQPVSAATKKQVAESVSRLMSSGAEVAGYWSFGSSPNKFRTKLLATGSVDRQPPKIALEQRELEPQTETKKKPRQTGPGKTKAPRSKAQVENQQPVDKGIGLLPENETDAVETVTETITTTIKVNHYPPVSTTQRSIEVTRFPLQDTNTVSATVTNDGAVSTDSLTRSDTITIVSSSEDAKETESRAKQNLENGMQDDNEVLNNTSAQEMTEEPNRVRTRRSKHTDAAAASREIRRRRRTNLSTSQESTSAEDAAPMGSQSSADSVPTETTNGQISSGENKPQSYQTRQNSIRAAEESANTAEEDRITRRWTRSASKKATELSDHEEKQMQQQKSRKRKIQDVQGPVNLPRDSYRQLWESADPSYQPDARLNYHVERFALQRQFGITTEDGAQEYKPGYEEALERLNEKYPAVVRLDLKRQKFAHDKQLDKHVDAFSERYRQRQRALACVQELGESGDIDGALAILLALSQGSLIVVDDPSAEQSSSS